MKTGLFSYDCHFEKLCLKEVHLCLNDSIAGFLTSEKVSRLCCRLWLLTAVATFDALEAVQH